MASKVRFVDNVGVSAFGSVSSGDIATGSLLVTASAELNTITFTKGDNTTFPITINTGSGGSGGSGIFAATGSYQSTTNTLVITGSTLEASPYQPTYPDSSITSSEGTNKYAMVVSQSIYHYNNNIGVPSSKAWKTDLDGSHFNNFDHNSNTSEILRFMAGLLSSSAPAASPNSKTFNAIGETLSNTNTGTAPAGRIPSASSNDTILYLSSKNFTSQGQTIFNSISPIYTNSLFNIVYSSSAAGSTIVSSSNDTELFGLGTIATDRPFNVSGSFNFKFEDNNSNSSTATSSSIGLLSNSSPGVTDGLTLGNISTGNELIPNTFQDGKFVGVFQSNLYNNSVDFTTTGSIGFYEISASIKINSGSSTLNNYSSEKVSNKRVFYAPISNLNTDIPNNSIQLNNPFSESISVVSRSLSGAPYLISGTYRISSSISNLFNPMYAASTVARLTKTDSLISIGEITNLAYSASLAGGTIQTPNAVYSSAGIVRSTSTVPAETDIVRLSGSISFNATSGATNIQSSGLGTTTFDIITKTTPKSNSEGNERTDGFSYINQGDFGQPTDSGSMAYYGQVQGYDGGSLTGVLEQFTGETYRVKIDNNLLTGKYSSATKFTTASYSDYSLDKYDLQVKPGYLVPAGGSNGYWLNEHSTSTGGYKYYARAFQVTTNKGNIFLDIGQSLVKWNETTNDSVAAAIMFESAQVGIDTGGGVLARPKLYDFATLSGPDPGTNQTTNDQLNPFSINIDIGGNQSGELSGTQYKLPLVDSLNQILATAGSYVYPNFIILIRYKGNPTPVEDITISYT